MLAWYLFSHSFTFNLLVSLYLKWIFFFNLGSIYLGLAFPLLNQIWKSMLLKWDFKTISFKALIKIVGFKSTIFLFIFYLSDSLLFPFNFGSMTSFYHWFSILKKFLFSFLTAFFGLHFALCRVSSLQFSNDLRVESQASFRRLCVSEWFVPAIAITKVSVDQQW